MKKQRTTKSGVYKSDYWELLSNLQKIRNYYDEFGEACPSELSLYINDIEKSREYNLDTLDFLLDELEVKTKGFWKELISKSAGSLINSVEKRTTRGQTFAEDLIKLKQIRDEIKYASLDILTLNITYSDLVETRNKIKEKLELEEFENNRFWQGIIIGAVAGLILGLLVPYLLVYIANFFNSLTKLF